MKKFASLVLALVLVLSLCPAAFAADETAAAAKELYDMGLITGMGTKRDGSVDLGLDTHPTRGQSMAILIRILGKTEAAVSKTINTPFTDVPAWAAQYVGYAYESGIAYGMDVDKFGTDSPVTGAQYVTFLLRALGYESGADFEWSNPWSFADKLGVTHGQYSNSTDFNRGDMCAVSLAALGCCVKGTTKSIRDSFTSKEISVTGAKADADFIKGVTTVKVDSNIVFNITTKDNEVTNVAIFPSGYGSAQYPAENCPNLVQIQSFVESGSGSVLVPASYFVSNPLNTDEYVLKAWRDDQAQSIYFKSNDLPVANTTVQPDEVARGNWKDYYDVAFYNTIKADYAKSYDIKSNSLKIYTTSQLAALAAFTSKDLSNNFALKYVELMNDLDMSAHD